MNRFYSQSGEDFLLSEIFKKQKSGFFVEVGCIDGRRFSNTLYFEQIGWKGICVEAHCGYIELLRQNRPESIVFHCAAAEVDEESATFYANSRGSLSTLDASKENLWREKYSDFFSGFEEQMVTKRRLDKIFDECGVKEIDILSLDIEGYEVEALRGIDFNKYKPKVMVIESDTFEHTQQIEYLINPFGYKKILRLGCNLFYSIDDKLALAIKNKHFKKIQLTHTEHPIDNDGDKTTLIDIDTRKKSIFKQKLNRLKSLVLKKIQ